MRIQFTTRAQVDAYTASDLIECLECGKKFQFLGSHLQRKHGISCDEYRELWGLPAMTPLAGQAYRKMHRSKLMRLRADGRLTYDHLPAATAKAIGVPREKIGVAKSDHSALIAKLRPGDARKLAPGAKRTDGRDADIARAAQARRRSGEVLLRVENVAGKFAQTEDDFLLSNYSGRGGAQKCAEALNRNVDSIKGRARLLGLMDHRGASKLWTDEDDDIIARHFPIDGPEFVSEKLGRTIAACHVRAGQLGVKRITKTKRPGYVAPIARRIKK